MDLVVRNILSKGLSAELIDEILSKYYEIFIAVFTSKGFDKFDNYEFFEQLGNLLINKFIVTYMSRRFPHLRSSSGVGVLATLRIQYASKETLSKLSEKYGFDKFVRCTQNELVDKAKLESILEDVFEVFFGATEFVLDKLYNGSGYTCVYKILKSMFDDIDVELSYDSLVDAKTKLNELKDIHKILIMYDNERLPDGMFRSKAVLTYQNYKKEIVGVGMSNKKKAANIEAADKALKWIEENLNITKQVPERFSSLPSKIWL